MEEAVKHVFIINSAAGGRGRINKAQILSNEAERFYVSHRLQYDGPRFTSKPGDATMYAKEAVERYGNPVIYCIGGDGTLNDIAAAIVNTDAKLVIIPKGSGNDFFRLFSDSIKDIYERSFNGHFEKINVLRVNDMFSFNVTSVGLDANAAYYTSLMKHKNYIVGLLKALRDFESPLVNITYNGQSIEQYITLLAFCNGRYYGHNVSIGPRTEEEKKNDLTEENQQENNFMRLTDNTMDICLVKKMNNSRVLVFLPYAMKGVHDKLEKYVSFDQTNHITVSSDKPLYWNVDGEIKTWNNVDISLNPDDYVNICVPQKVYKKTTR